MKSLSTRLFWSLTILWHTEYGGNAMKKPVKLLLKILGKLILAALAVFVVTFTIYMTNSENKLIYYVVRPLLNKHYDSQVRDRRV